jgi:putative ABC transport system permease protein
VNPGEAFVRALRNLAVHKLQSALTMLGMIFGVGAVIAMLSIGAGAEKKAQQMIQRMGLSNILVRSRDYRGDELQEIRKKSQGLSPRDAAGIEEAVPGVDFAGPRVRINPYRVGGPAGKSDAKVFGVSWRHAQIVNMPVGEGRFLSETDEKTHAQVCVIGPGVRRDLFGWGEALGQDLKVNDVWLTVVGVLETSSEGGDSFQGIALGSAASEIYLPVTTALRKFDRDPMEPPLHELIVHLNPGTPPRETAALVSALLDRLHGGANDVDLVVPEALLEQSRRTQRLFNVVMGCIAGISLLVGGIGIMNIMLATVLERTREIGVRRAIGARRRDIRFQFVVEAFSLSVTGGLLGVILGIAIAKIVAASAGWPTVVTISSLVLSTGVSATVGLASGIYPAMRAAALHPIDALRYE